MTQLARTLRNFGPGLIMASSAIGGSHIIASTQAGIKFGYHLAFFIIVVNLVKYPFYRFAFRYTLENKHSVLDGYAQKGPFYVGLFLLFNSVATVVNIAGGTLLSAALLAPLLPMQLSLTNLSILVLFSFLLILKKKQYRVLDIFSKNIMLILSVVTIIAFIMAVKSALGHSAPLSIQNYHISSPWTLASIPFLIALMGWMPAPMELSVATSLWVVEKQRLDKNYMPKGLLDFNVGYGITILFALVFMGLGALVQYNQGTQLAGGGRFVAQFVDMYALTIGEWTRWFIGLLAFICIYGTTLVAMDAYSRTNMHAVNLLCKRQHSAPNELFLWMLGAGVVSLIVILFFQQSVKQMILFAMTLSFISAPIFAWLNMSLYRHRYHKGMLIWASAGLLALILMLALYLANQAGLFV